MSQAKASALYDYVRAAVMEIRAAVAAARRTGLSAPVIAVSRKGSDFGHAVGYLCGKDSSVLCGR